MRNQYRRYPPKPEPVVVMPKFYHYRNRQESDKDWIMKRMAVIPTEKQAEVAEEYDRRYMIGKQSQNGRKAANFYLQAVAAKYREILRQRQQDAA